MLVSTLFDLPFQLFMSVHDIVKLGKSIINQPASTITVQSLSAQLVQSQSQRLKEKNVQT